MFFYELLVPPYYDVDIITIVFIAVVTALISFFLARDYIRENRKRYIAPKGKLIASIIVGIVSLIFTGPAIYWLIRFWIIGI
ncbi:MAG: hypothetical protein J6Q89_08125 [Clostridia bacterium]|nr:hypothetical protein [Clostridia bacterium]